MITLTREESQKVGQYIKPYAVVPVDMQTTQLLVNALRARLNEPTIDGWPLYSGLPQPEPEPMAYMDGKGHLYNSTTHPENYTPLYTASPQREWVGLTDEEIDKVAASSGYGYIDVARAIEAKLKEKNT